MRWEAQSRLELRAVKPGHGIDRGRRRIGRSVKIGKDGGAVRPAITATHRTGCLGRMQRT